MNVYRRMKYYLLAHCCACCNPFCIITPAHSTQNYINCIVYCVSWNRNIDIIHPSNWATHLLVPIRSRIRCRIWILNFRNIFWILCQRCACPPSNGFHASLFMVRVTSVNANSLRHICITLNYFHIRIECAISASILHSQRHDVIFMHWNVSTHD